MVVSAAEDDVDFDDETATISHAVTGYTGVTSADEVVVTVDDNDTPSAPAFAAGVTVGNQNYLVDLPVDVTLPVIDPATGNGTITYALMPGLPAGLSYADDTRVLNGTPSAATAAITLTYTAADSDTTTGAADEAALTFTMTVRAVSIGFERTTYTEREDVGQFQVCVVVTDPPLSGTMPPGSAEVTVGSAIGTATAGDFTAVNRTITFNETRRRDCLAVAITNDTVLENSEIFTLTLAPNAAASDFAVAIDSSAATSTVEIQDDDPLTVQWSAAAYTAGEEDGGVTVTLELDVPPGVTINRAAFSLGVSTHLLSGDTATAGSDFTALLNQQVGPFNNTTRSHTVVVPILDDTLVEGDETFGVAVGFLPGTLVPPNTALRPVPPPGSGLFGGAAYASVTITDDDTDTAPAFASGASVPAQSYTENTQITALTLPEVDAGTGNGVITYTLTPIPAGLSFTTTTRVLSGTPNAVTAAATLTLTYTAADADTTSGAADEASLIFAITVNLGPGIALPPAPLTVTEGESGAYAVQLDTIPNGGDVTVALSLAGGDATFQPARLTFSSATWNTAQSVTVTPATDADATANTDVTIRHAASGADYATVAAEALRVVVPEAQTIGVTISPASLALVEAASGIYTVALTSAPVGGDVTVTPSSDNTSVVPTPAAGLVFTAVNWNQAQTISVLAATDGDTFNDVATITNAVAGADYDGAAAADVVVSVTDTDIQGVTVSKTALTVGEGGIGTYTVALSVVPSGGDVVIRPTIDTAIATIEPAAGLTFSSSNSHIAQTFTVTGVQDADAADDTTNITHGAFGADYDGVPIAAVAVTVTDDETVSVEISDSTLTVMEGGAGAYTVTLTSEPVGGNVTVTPSIATGTDLTLSPAAGGLTFTAGNWNVAQMVALSTAEDDDAVDDAVVITHAATGADYDAAPAVTVAVTIDDNDNVGVTVTPDTLALNENEFATYTVELTSAPSIGEVTVTPSSADTGAVSVTAALVFAAANWDTPQVVSVGGVTDADTTNESVEITNTVTVSDGASEYAAATADEVTVTVTDTSIPAVTIAPTDLTVDEGGNRAYTVQLATEPDAGAQVMVTPSVGGDVAVHGVTIAPSAALLFDAATWNTAQSVVVSAAQDDLDFTDATATISHAVAGYTGVTGAADVVVTVDDNDTDSAPAFASGASVPAQSYTENAQITALVLPEVAPAPATQGNGDITYMLTPIPSGLNFDATNRVLSGTPSAVTAATTTTLTYTAADEDGNTADTDTASLLFTVTVSPAAPVTPAALVFAQTAVSVDEGATGGYTVELSVAPDSGNVTVTPDATTGLTFAPAALTFTATSWDTAQSVTITATRDDDTANETLTVSHAVAGAGNYAALTAGGDVTVTVTDTSIPAVTIAPTDLTVDEGVDGAYTVQLATEPATGAQVMVTPTVQGAGHGVTIAPSAALVFDSTNWNTAQSVVVSAAQDDLDFTDATATISHAVAGYTGVTGADNVVVTVDDNDTDSAPAFASGASVPAQSYTENAQIPALVLPEVAPAPATQGNGDITYTLTPIPSGLSFTATTRTLSGTASAVAAATTTTLTYTAADEDNIIGASDEDALTFTVTINPAPPAVVTLRLEPDALTVDEGADAVAGSIYTVRLSSQPASDVTVTPSIAATDHDLMLTFDGAALLGAALTFVTAEWNDAQTVTVTAAADDDITDDTVTITHAATGTSASIAAAEVVVTVDDTSTPGIMLDPDALTVAENARGTYTIRLNTIPLGDATITLTNTGAAHADVAPLTLTFAPGNWNVAQSVTVSGIEDEDAAAPAAFEITHRPTNYGSNAPFSDVVRVTVTETDTRGVTIAPTALPVDEGGNNFYTVALTSEPVGTVMVTPDASGGAFSGITITPTTALMFDSGNWNTAQTVSVFAGEDNGNFDDDTLTITHAVTGYGSVTSAAHVVVTVDDNDTAPVTPAVTIAPPTLTIAEGAMDTYTVTLTTDPGGAVTVTPTSDNIADVPTPAALTFAAGAWNTPQAVTVTANADVLEDFADESAEITHVVAGYSGVATAPAVAVTVTDPHTDTVPSFAATQGDQAYTVGETVDLTLPVATGGNGAPRYTLTPDIATAIDGLTFDDNTRIVSGMPNAVTTAAVTLTYTAADSDTNNADTDTASLTFTVTVNPAAVVTPAGVTISTPTLTVTEGGDGNYTVRLDTIPSGSVTITPTIPSNTDLTGNPSALTFTAMNWNAVQTVTLTAAEDDDAVDDAPVVITHTVAGADYGSNNITAANVTATITENDDVGITVAPTDLNIDEGGASGTYTVVLTSAPSVGNVTVMRDNGDPAAKLGFGSSPTSLLFTAANWNMPQTVSVGGATDSDDTDDVATITHMVTVSDVMSDYDGATAAPVTVNVNDTGRDELRINPTTLTINEDGSGIYTIRLSSNTTGGAVAVVTPMSADTAIATVFPTTPITFSSGTWATERTITVRGVADADFDNETVTITHTVTGYNAPPAVVTVTVLDTTPADTAPAFVSGVPVPDQTYTAGTQIATLTLPEVDSNNPGNGAPVYTLTPQADIPGGLNFDDTARTLSGTPNAVAAATTVTLTYTVADSDGVSGAADEDSLTFTITVNPATPVTSAGVTISTPTLTVTEGGDGNYTVVLDTQPSADVMITPSVTPATATVSPTGALTFTAGNWNDEQTVTVTGVADADATDNTPAVVSHASTSTDTDYDTLTNIDSVTVTITEAQTRGVTFTPPNVAVGEGGDATYTVELDSEPTGNVTVTLSVSGDVADHGVTITTDTTLTFDDSNWDTPQDVSVAAAEDDADFAHETATISHAVDGADYATTNADDVVVTVTDDDSDSAPRFAAGTTQTDETYTAGMQITDLVLPEVDPNNAGNGAVTYALTPLPSGLVFTANTRTLSGTPNAVSTATTTTLTYTAADEDDITGAGDEASLTFTVTVNPAAPAAVVTLRLEPDALAIDEGAAAVAGSVYTVRLSSQPASDVTVTPSIAAASHDLTLTFDGAALLGAALTFVAAEWNDAQTVTVTAADDGDMLDDTVTITHAATGTSASIADADVTVTVTDDDMPARGVTLAGTPVNVAEGSSAEYTVVLDTQPSGNVTVTPASGDASVATVSGALTFSDSNWDTAQTVTVTGADDANGVTDTTTITHTVEGADYAGVSVAADPVTVTVTDTDTTRVVISDATLTVDEGDDDTYTVRLDTQPSGEVTITPSSDNAVATVSGALTFTTTNWNDAQSVTVTGTADDDATANAGAVITHAATGADADYNALAAIDSVAVTVDETNMRGVTLSGAPVSVTEGLSAEYTVVLTSAPDGGDVTVTASIPANTDLSLISSGVLTFDANNWNVAQPVSLTAAHDDDAVADDDITITHTVAGADYGSNNITAADVTATITEDDSVGVTVSPLTVAVDEMTTDTYTVALTSAPSVGEVTVTASSADTGAVAIDISTVALVFDAGNWNMPQTISVGGAMDADADAEAVMITNTVTVSDSSSDYDGANAANVTVNVTDTDMASVTISAATLSIDEDGDGTYTIVLTSAPSGGGTATVTPVSADPTIATVSGALVFDANNWNMTQNVVVTGVADDDVDNEMVSITHTVSGYTASAGKVDVTVTDTSVRGVTVPTTPVTVTEGTPGTYEVVLNTQPTGNVTVTPASDDDDIATVSGALTFSAGNWDTAQNITVTGTEDADSADESTSITHSVTGADYESNNVTAANVAVTVNDDETAGVTISTATLAVGEGSNNTYTVELTTPPTGPVAVVLMIDNSDVTADATTLNFTTGNWNTEQTVTISATEDPDGNHDTASITHTVSGGGYDGASITNAVVTVTVTDNDPLGIMLSATTLSVGENGTGNYTVELATEPDGNVTITPTSADPAAATVSAALTFTDSNWNTAQQVEVTGVADDDATDENFNITHAASGSADYAAVDLTAALVTVTVTDNNTRDITLSGTMPVTVAEGATANYGVVLDTQPTGDVTVTPSSDTPAVATVSAALVFGPSNWNTVQNVVVTGVEDANTEDDSASITHAVTGADYATVTLANVAVTVTDNDMPGVTISTATLTIGEDTSSGAGNTYNVVLNTEPSGDVAVALSSDNTDVTLNAATLNFGAGNWNTAQNVIVSAAEDADATDDSADITHTVSGANYAGATISPNAVVTVTVTDSDTRGVTIAPTSVTIPEGDSNTYTVVLTSAPDGGDVMVTPSIPGGNDLLLFLTGGAPAATAVLTFNMSNWNVAQPVTLTATADDDAVDDADIVITHTVAGADYDSETAADVTATITEGNTVGITVNPTTLAVTEGAAAGSYTVRLTSAPSAGNVVVTPSSADTDAVSVSGALMFDAANWNTPQVVSVGGVADDDAVDETGVVITNTVTVSAPASDYASQNAADVTVNVTDPNTAGVTVSTPTLTVAENGNATYTIVLTSAPSGGGNAMVTPASANTAIATVSSALVFGPTNWNMPQDVIVTGVADADADNEMVNITHTVSGYDSVTTVDPVAVTVTDPDTVGVMLSTDTVTLTESTTGDYTVRLTTQPSANVTITPDGDGDAIATVSGALTFSPANWNTTQQVVITGVADANTETDTVTITHTAASADTDYNGISIGDVTATVTDTDTAGVTISNGTRSIQEGSNSGADNTYTVVLNTQPNGAVTVALMSSDTDAVMASVATLNFSAADWNTPKDVVLTGVEDDDGNNETVNIMHTVSGANYNDAVVSPDPVVVTVTDDDPLGITLSATTLSVTEDATANYTVRLDTRPDGEVTITPSSDDNDAAGVSGALVFTRDNWNTAQQVVVTGEEDDDATNETVEITHTITGSADYVAVDVSGDTVAVTVTDNDPRGVTFGTLAPITEGASGAYSVVLDTEPTGNVTVTPMSGNIAIATVSPAGGLIFSTANWNTAQSVIVTGVEDDDTANENTRITHAVSGADYATTNADDVAVTITDDDMPGVMVSQSTLMVDEGAMATYTLRLNTQPSADVVITATPNPATATVTGPLTFTMANWNTAQTITVTGVEDADAAANANAVIRHAATSTDAGYNNLAGIDTVTVTVTDTDSVGVTVSQTTPLAVGEEAFATYTVVLTSAPSVGIVTVTPDSADDGAVSVTGALVFTAADWDTPQTVSVGGVVDEDTVNEMVVISHMVSVSVGSSDYAGATVTPATVTVNVTDNDMPGVTLSRNTLDVGENATANYTVRLNTQPSGNVTITPMSADTDIATVSAALVFGTGNWNTPQPVTVTGADDADATNEMVNITHAATGSADYAAVDLTAEIVAVSVTDNDPRGVTFSPDSVTVLETEAVTYTVMLTSEPTGSVMVTPSSSAPAVATVSPTSALVFSAANWNVMQTVTVTGADDDDSAEGNAVIRHAVTGADYTGVIPADVTVTVNDNDTPGVTVSATTLTVEEGGNGIYTVRLNTAPTGNVVITPSSDDTAAATVSGPLTFATGNWNVMQTVTVTGADDPDAADATANITHRVSGYTGVTTAAAVAVTVTDTDTASVTVTPTMLATDEGTSSGVNNTYTVVLDTLPSGNVVITPTSDSLGDVTINRATLNFNTGNWNTPQQVVITAAEDGDSTDDTATISHTATGAAEYAALADIDSVVVTVTDNDTPAVVLSQTTPLALNEGETREYTVVLRTEPAGRCDGDAECGGYAEWQRRRRHRLRRRWVGLYHHQLERAAASRHHRRTR